MNANVGMQYPVFAPVDTYTPGTSITYETGIVIAEAVSASINWERADGSFYGDDILLDSDNGVLGYTIDFEPSGLSDAARAALLGEVSSGTGGEYSIGEDASPDGGFGYIRVMRSNAGGTVAYSYEGWWYHKLKFGVSSEETRTKERGTEWRVPTLNGVGAGVSLDNTGKMSFAVHKTFDTLAAAKTWLKGKAGIT